MTLKTALITGINGQDGSYLAEYLLKNGYRVWGCVRRNSIPENQTARVNKILNKINIEHGDILDKHSIIRLLRLSRPDEIYHLAAQSHVQVSFIEPELTINNNLIGSLNLFEAVREICPESKIYNAASSEMFGNEIDTDNYQRESTPMVPVSPYGLSKLATFNLTKIYRHSYGIHISNGILFNHESPRRGSNFVTTKIIKGALDIVHGKTDKLVMGNVNSSRDWGHAKEYVKGMHQICTMEEPIDIILATGESHTVKEACEYVFSYFNLDVNKHIVFNSKYKRLEDVSYLRGDITKAKQLFGWNPHYKFKNLFDHMIEYWELKYYD